MNTIQYGLCGNRGLIMKKVTYIILAIIFMFGFTGCDISDIGETTEFDPHTPGGQDEYCQPILDEVIRCLDENDAETLKSMFSEYIAKNCDLDEQIKNAMDVYDGKSISCDGYTCEYSSYHIYYGYYKEYTSRMEYESVITDSGQDYNIVVRYCIVYDEHPECVGLKGIDIRDNNYEYDLEHTNNRIALIGSSL